MTPQDQAELVVAPGALTGDPHALIAAARRAGEEPGALPEAADLAPARAGAVCLLELAPEELLEALDGLLMAPRADRALRMAERLGIFAVVLPEVAALVEFHLSCPVHHKDLWDHTCRVIQRMAPDVDLRWSALLHDVGKLATRRVEHGKVTFWRHEQLGAWLARGVAARLAFPVARAERIGFVVGQHGRVNAYERGWSDRAVRRLQRDLGGRIEDLLAFSRADFTTRRDEKRARIVSDLSDLQQRLEALEAAAATPPALPSGLGHAVRAQLGLAGPDLGEALAWLTAEVETGTLPRGAEPTVYLDALAQRP